MPFVKNEVKKWELGNNIICLCGDLHVVIFVIMVARCHCDDRALWLLLQFAKRKLKKETKKIHEKKIVEIIFTYLLILV
jgi:hypothetical protein